MSKRSRPSAEEFIEAWQTSTTSTEAARKLGMRRESATERARIYRLDGIPLRHLDGRKPRKSKLVDLALSLGGGVD